jgi:hypothetical protein
VKELLKSEAFMANNDITSDVNTDETLVNELKEQQHKQTVERTLEKNPLQMENQGLQEGLLEMLKRNITSALFSGVERCIRIVDKGSTNQRHCMSMMVSDATNGKVCTRCFKQPNPGVVRPTVINSSMIRLNDKELKECGLTVDPTFVPPERRGGVIETKPFRIKEEAPKAKRQYTRREPKVAVPNAVKIEIGLKDLDSAKNITHVLLQKALEAIYELPITKFSEAEAIRGTSERIKQLMAQQGE